jgi:hypothetical protein
VPENKPTSKNWLGFFVMEQLAINSDIIELYSIELVAYMITRGISQHEAEEMKNARVAFLRVPQLLLVRSAFLF